MPKLEELKPKIDQRPCHICGGRKFEWGYLPSLYRLHRNKFGSEAITPRKCVKCGNIQNFADAGLTQKRKQQANFIAFLAFFGWIGMIILALLFAVVF